MPRQLPPRGLTLGGEWPRWRSTAAAFTALSALAASLVTAPAVAEPLAGPCALHRTPAHHSEGLDSWNSAYPRPVKVLDALMVFLSFPDSRPTATPAELATDYFPATSRFYEQASYGRFTLRPHPQPAWARMPLASTEYAIRRDWDPAHRAAYLRDAVAAADPQVDFTKYDIVYLVADPDAPGVDSDATKVVNLDRPMHADGTDIRRLVTVFERHPPDRNVLAHETGHVFDLPDLYHRPMDGKGDWDTYVGDWDVMGSQFGLAPDFFAWHKWKLGWLDPRQVVCVQGRRDTHLTLDPLGAAPVPALRPPVAAGQPAAPGGGGGGTKLAVIRTGREDAIAIEARGDAGNDTSVCRQGVLVYRVRSETESGGGPLEVVDAHPRTEACAGESVYPPLADATVRVGETFRIPNDRFPIDLRVENRTPTGAWTITISTG